MAPHPNNRSNEWWDGFWRKTCDGSLSPDWLSESPRRQVVEAVRSGWLAPPGRVLDVGCGIGNSSQWLREEGFQVVGIEVSPAAVARARELWRGDGLRFEVDDCCLPVSDLGTFSVILDLGVLHALSPESRGLYARNLAAWSEPGAHLLLLMRYGAPLHESVSVEDLRSEVRHLLLDEFELVSESLTDMAAEGRPARTGMEFRLARRPQGSKSPA
jgi:SAM-dependent methyltransferase